MNWRNETVFVTGATGFIGGRVCERMMQARAPKVRALVHGMHRASRIARMPVELCPGTCWIADRCGKRWARQGCNPLRAGSREQYRAGDRKHAGGGARGRGEAIHPCQHGGYLRDHTPSGSETEDAPLRRTGDAYCDNKTAAEEVVLDYGKRGLPVVILRPSIVWGPTRHGQRV